MSMVLETGETGNRLVLDGAIDIAVAAELKQVLLQARETKKPTTISVDGVTDIDITAAQLLWAATRAARGSESRPVVAGAIPAAVSALLTEAGMNELLEER